MRCPGTPLSPLLPCLRLKQTDSGDGAATACPVQDHETPATLTGLSETPDTRPELTAPGSAVFLLKLPFPLMHIHKIGAWL